MSPWKIQFYHNAKKSLSTLIQLFFRHATHSAKELADSSAKGWIGLILLLGFSCNFLSYHMLCGALWYKATIPFFSICSFPHYHLYSFLFLLKNSATDKKSKNIFHGGIFCKKGKKNA